MCIATLFLLLVCNQWTSIFTYIWISQHTTITFLNVYFRYFENCILNIIEFALKFQRPLSKLGDFVFHTL